MQNLFDFIAANTAIFIGLLVFVVFTIGLVLALRTESGRAALARASVRLAVFALAMAEKWIGKQINGDKLAHMADNGGAVPPQHPIISAQVDLLCWLGDG
jgi:hypothetical protein